MPKAWMSWHDFEQRLNAYEDAEFERMRKDDDLTGVLPDSWRSEPKQEREGK